MKIRDVIPTATDDVIATCEAVGLNADDVASDVHRIRTGATTREQLLALCQDGAASADGTAEAWSDYVRDVCIAAGRSAIDPNPA